ncbi:hypothetical protein K7X08_005953 [Anisodus acutangulus]|uniref:Uncharacterized protein n=1 Tax=Anisodus acutangulus TaxID=402998 RepID=A0A9Q1LRY7_9SOLA|nr:hypothetical protein K7X08_005953 [Anisodus acutangulus]
MTPRKIDMTLGALAANPQEQFEDLVAQQLELRTIMNQRHQEMRNDMDRRQAELLQMVNAIKDSLDGVHLHQRSKETSSTSAPREMLRTVMLIMEF